VIDRTLLGGVLRRSRLQPKALPIELQVVLYAGISFNYLSDAELGKKEVSSELLAAICKPLGLTTTDLLRAMLDSAILEETARQMAAEPRAEVPVVRPALIWSENGLVPA
jgi:transcriptional regulator with XRE-family HTH domain